MELSDERPAAVKQASRLRAHRQLVKRGRRRGQRGAGGRSRRGATRCPVGAGRAAGLLLLLVLSSWRRRVRRSARILHVRKPTRMRQSISGAVSWHGGLSGGRYLRCGGGRPALSFRSATPRCSPRAQPTPPRAANTPLPTQEEEEEAEQKQKQEQQEQEQEQEQVEQVEQEQEEDE